MIEIIIGTFFILIFVWIQYSKSRCTQKIDATYLKFSIYSRADLLFSKNYKLVFKYEFNGNEYKNEAQQLFSKKFTKNFVVGEKYTILINEKNPKKFIIDRKIRINEISLLLMGLFCEIWGLIEFIVDIKQ